MFDFPNQDPRDYFDSQQASALKSSRETHLAMESVKCSSTAQEAYHSVRGSISQIKSVGVIDPIVTPEVAFKVAEYLSNCNVKARF